MMNDDNGGVHVRRVHVDLRVLKEVDLMRRMYRFVVWLLYLLRRLWLLLLLLRLLVRVNKCFTRQRLLRLRVWFCELRRLYWLRFRDNFLDDRFGFLRGFDLHVNLFFLGAFLTVGCGRRRGGG